jgi:hypothetical protein
VKNALTWLDRHDCNDIDILSHGFDDTFLTGARIKRMPLTMRRPTAWTTACRVYRPEQPCRTIESLSSTPDGYLTGTYFIAADDDRKAVKQARQPLERQDIELWDGERLVGRFSHDRPRRERASGNSSKIHARGRFEAGELLRWKKLRLLVYTAIAHISPQKETGIHDINEVAQDRAARRRDCCRHLVIGCTGIRARRLRLQPPSQWVGPMRMGRSK